LSLKVLETPGHVLEGLALVASETQGGGVPWGLFSGDLIFEGDIARPEPRLDDGFGVADLADMLYDSLHRKLLKLPPEIRVFSGHRPQPGGTEPRSLAEVRRNHPLLRPQTRRSFVDALTRGRLPAPLTRSTRNALNRSLETCRTIGVSNRVPEFAPADLLAAVDRGAVALDLREPMEYAAGHVRGSLSLGLGANFEPWAASLLDPTDHHLLICNPGSEEEATLRLRPLIGVRIMGLCSTGLTAFEGMADRLETTGPAVLRPFRLDVGIEPSGFRAAQHVPLEQLLGRLDELPPLKTALEVLDEDPQRAWSAVSLLQRKGWTQSRPGPAIPEKLRRRMVGS
jgi:hydroxyacylglutathione hydrolase